MMAIVRAFSRKNVTGSRSGAQTQLRPFLFALILAVVLVSQGDAVSVEVYALKYGESDYNNRYVFADGDGKPVRFAWMFWLVKEGAQAYLVDAGIEDPTLVSRWKIRDYATPTSLLKQLSVDTKDIVAIIATHLHGDHIDGALAFPDKPIYVQRREYEAMARAMVKDSQKDYTGGYFRRHYAHLQKLEREGRLVLVEGNRQITPNIAVELAPFHTLGTQTVLVRTPSRTIYLVPDNAYLRENITALRLPANSRDAAGHLEYLRRLASLDPQAFTVIPGHDPGLFVGDGLVGTRIRDLIFVR